MTRSVSEWRGKSDDSAIPARVRDRVWLRDDGRCQCGCARKILAGEQWQTDHAVALANGGENCESNLRTLLVEHHKVKSASDVAEKARVYKTRTKHNGIKRKPKGRPMMGTKASGWKHKVNGEWERRS